MMDNTTVQQAMYVELIAKEFTLMYNVSRIVNEIYGANHEL